MSATILQMLQKRRHTRQACSYPNGWIMQQALQIAQSRAEDKTSSSLQKIQTTLDQENRVAVHQ
jgi:hypothetical protein